jgi:hypothetical protein
LILIERHADPILLESPIINALLGPLLAWIQTTRIAAAIGGSTLLTGFISGIHLLGLTLLVGASLVSSLRMAGIILTDRPMTDVTPGPVRGMLVGLTISVVSGLLLFAPRAAAAADNSFFQVKMALLGAAALFHFAVYRGISRRTDAESSVVKLTGGIGLILWLGVAVAGCAFILFE